MNDDKNSAWTLRKALDRVLEDPNWLQLSEETRRTVLDAITARAPETEDK